MTKTDVEREINKLFNEYCKLSITRPPDYKAKQDKIQRKIRSLRLFGK